MLGFSKGEVYRLNLSYEQKLQLWQFRVRVILSFSAFYLGMAALIFDFGIAKRYAPWLTSLVSFIIGWWMPSPGNPPSINNQQEISTDRAFIVQDNEQK